jgi:hypothetical protein
MVADGKPLRVSATAADVAATEREFLPTTLELKLIFFKHAVAVF